MGAVWCVFPVDSYLYVPNYVVRMRNEYGLAPREVATKFVCITSLMTRRYPVLNTPSISGPKSRYRTEYISVFR